MIGLALPLTFNGVALAFCALSSVKVDYRSEFPSSLRLAPRVFFILLAPNRGLSSHPALARKGQHDPLSRSDGPTNSVTEVTEASRIQALTRCGPPPIPPKKGQFFGLLASTPPSNKRINLSAISASSST